MKRITNHHLKVDIITVLPLGRSLGRLIFECYKPKTLEEVHEYIDFLLSERAILPQEIEEPDVEVLESEIIQAHPKKDFDFLLNHESNTKIRSQRFATYLRIEEEKRRGIYCCYI